MGLSTNLISGLASGFDWRTMIDEIMKIEHWSVDLVEARKRKYEEKLTE
jgi:flagellar hook-associated protein 2